MGSSDVRFTLLVPFNLFGLARPVTAFLAMAAPTYEAMRVLEGGSDASITNMLTYWVLFGFIMTIESLMGRLIERQFRMCYKKLRLTFSALPHLQAHHTRIPQPPSTEGGESVK